MELMVKITAEHLLIYWDQTMVDKRKLTIILVHPREVINGFD